jgi:outer membrane receptor protein involved in Fe transport
MSRGARLVLLLLSSLGASNAFAQLAGTQLVGQVVDASTKKPVEGVVVTATSPSLQGEQVVLTDVAGNYRIPQLTHGSYTLRFDKDSYRPYLRTGIELRAEATIRLDIELLPEMAGEESIVVTAKPPTVDVGSTTTGAQISSSFIQAIPLARDQRSFDQLAVVAPGVQMDAFGAAISGATSPENQFIVDGLSTTNVVSGLSGSPVNVEFIDQVNVITGGLMPEYGRATGGVVSAITKSGGNEFHGSVFGTWTPGPLADTPPAISSGSGTFSTTTKLYNRWDVGATLGGYIVKNRLWFFAGFDASQVKNVQTRTTNYLEPDPSKPPWFEGAEFNSAAAGQSPYPGTSFVQPLVDPTTGFPAAHPIPGSDIRQFSPDTNYQYIGKLTFLLNPDQRFSFTVLGQANSEVSFPNVASAYTRATAVLIANSFFDVSGRWQGSFVEKRLLVDVTAGWHHEPRSFNVGSQSGIADSLTGMPIVAAGNYHNLTEFSQSYGSVPSQCNPVPYPASPDDPGTPRIFYPCPLSGASRYVFGGPGYSITSDQGSTQGSAVITWLARALGSHVVKVGLSVTQQVDDVTEAYSGGRYYLEDVQGGAFYTVYGFGVLTGPDVPIFPPSFPTHTTSTSIGGFIQDSWNILDKVTLNVGFRYDTQSLYGAGKLGMALPNQWSPRIGVIWDPTYQGRSKLYASFGTYHENVPLDIAYAYFPGVPSISSWRSYLSNVVGAANVCNPIRDPSYPTTCTNPANLVRPGLFLSANGGWQDIGNTSATVDPNIQGQSTSEIVIGGEYEVFANARLGATFTRRWINKVIEDMADDYGATYFIGNPGYGIADYLPKAVRNYTAVSVFLTKSFAQLWQAQLSYTYQSLVGNYEGLIGTGSGTDVQVHPNDGAAFDLRSLVVNSSGRLPGDITHTIKAFGSYEWVILPTVSVTFGGALTASSGRPYGYLGFKALDYGPGTVFILARNSAGTLPWVWNLDVKLGVSIRVAQDTSIYMGVDCFNVVNSAQVTAIDENYTFFNVLPILGGTAQGLKGDPSTLHYADGTAYQHTSDNMNYGRPQAYQPARAFRFSARVTF